jgi:hypothetical protein
MKGAIIRRTWGDTFSGEISKVPDLAATPI